MANSQAASRRAIEDLYIHISEGCERKEIENSLKSFVKKSGLTIDYEFIE